jgi:hypothetical protein
VEGVRSDVGADSDTSEPSNPAVSVIPDHHCLTDHWHFPDDPYRRHTVLITNQISNYYADHKGMNQAERAETFRSEPSPVGDRVSGNSRGLVINASFYGRTWSELPSEWTICGSMGET